MLFSVNLLLFIFVVYTSTSNMYCVHGTLNLRTILYYQYVSFKWTIRHLWR